MTIDDARPADTHALGSSEGSRLAHLDGWRGLAILLVLEAHFYQLLPLEAGRLGVDIFFCLSGWLMSGILFIQREHLARFYKRRISRIVPAFLAFVVIIHGLASATGLPYTPTELLATIAFLRTYLPIEPGIWKSAVPIGHLWSLNIEEHCYVFMSLIIALRLLRGREHLLLLGAGLSCMAIGQLYVRWPQMSPPWGALGTEVAAAHLLLAAGYRLLRAKADWSAPAWVAPLALMVGAACYLSVAPWWAGSLIAPIAMAVAIGHLGDSYALFKRILSSRLLCNFGVYSYSIYLWQQPLYVGKAQIPGGGTTALALALGIAYVSFHCIEKPCRTWLNKYW